MKEKKLQKHIDDAVEKCLKNAFSKDSFLKLMTKEVSKAIAAKEKEKKLRLHNREYKIVEKYVKIVSDLNETKFKEMRAREIAEALKPVAGNLSIVTVGKILSHMNAIKSTKKGISYYRIKKIKNGKK